MAAPDPRRGLRMRARRGRVGRTRMRRGRGRGRFGARRAGGAGAGARQRLRNFRQATIVAVALTGLILLLFAPDEAGMGGAGAEAVAQEAPAAEREVPDTVAVIEPIAVEDLQADTAAEAEAALDADTLVRAATEEARQAVRNLWIGFLGSLPKVGVVLVVLLLAGLLVRIIRPLLQRVLRHWERANATTALVGIAIWLLAIGISFSILAGDIRALVGSVGLVGLALSWALQTPIESFTGWLMNSFHGYYRVGDRVSVGEVFGDVYRIDFLTTTVWEIGSPDRPGFVNAEQPTGRLITFPNNEVLAGSVVNFTRDFPYVWDELTVPVGNRSDLSYASEVLRKVAVGLLGDYMAEPAREYERILRAARLEASVAGEPQVFVSLAESWTDLTIRYLVGARERRRWKSALAKAVMEELDRPEHERKIISVFPRRQIQIIGVDGTPREFGALPGSTGKAGKTMSSGEA